MIFSRGGGFSRDTFSRRAQALAFVLSGLVGAGTAFAGTSTVTALPGAVTVTGPASATLHFPLNRSDDTAYDAWLNYATTDDSAQNGYDYTATAGQLHLPANATAVDIPITVLGSHFPLPDKTFKLKLSGIIGTGPAPDFAAHGNDTDFDTGSIPYSVATADVNGDGLPDLITANGIANTVSVLLNTTAPGATTPSFATKANFTTGNDPVSVTTADVNGDGLPDLITGNDNSPGSVSVLLNTTAPGAATPSFSTKVDFTTGNGPVSVTMADLNGDGLPDLIATNHDSNSVSVLLNTTMPGAATTTTPSFATKVDFTTSNNPTAVTAADLNGDGLPDLITANNNSPGSISVLLNTTNPGDATPSFATKANFTTGNDPTSVTTADLNSDGLPDLITANSVTNSVSVLLNNTNPGAAMPSFATKADFTTGNGATAVTTADVNGDGLPDLIAGNYVASSASVLLNTTTPGATTPSFATKVDFSIGNNLSAVTTADINGDGLPDLITANDNNPGSVSVLLNKVKPGAATPTFAAKADFTTGNDPVSVATADVNGDGLPDLITANGIANTVSVLLNTMAPGATTSSFATNSDFSTGDRPISVTTADVNGDGLPDLIAANSYSNSASVLLNATAPGAATPSFVAKANFTTGNRPKSVTTADVNGDGLPDLITANSNVDSVSVLLNTTMPGAATTTTPSFAAKADFTTGNKPQSVTTADVNGDGLPDLITANWGGSVSVLLNTTTPGAATTTTPSFATKVDSSARKYAYSVTTTDVNGDGLPDLIAANNNNPASVSVLLNTTTPGPAKTATPSFAEEAAFSSGRDSHSVTTADVNGDGLPDLIVANQVSHPVSVLLNTTVPGAATPTFAAKTYFTAGNGPTSVTAADLNDDGLPDLIVANGASNTVSVLLNTQYAISLTPTTVTGTIHYSIPEGDGVPTKLGFGDQPIGGGSANQTFTVNNTGNADLTIGSIALSGAQKTDYTESDTCPATVAAGDSCTITVTFTPTDTGTRAATLTITTNGPDSPQAIALTGKGVGKPPAASNLTLVAYENQSLAGMLPASDPQGHALAFSVTQPANGSVTLDDATTGAFTYRPATDFSGSDSFTFTAKDTVTDTQSNIAIVTITVNATPAPGNAAPVTASAELSVYTGQSLSARLQAADANDDMLTYRIANEPKHGTLKLANAATGAFTYTPAPGFTGQDNFTFAATDGHADSNTSTIKVEVLAVPINRVTVQAPPGGGGSSGGGGGGLGWLALLLLASMVCLIFRGHD